mgnify:CR=1 FL=1
MTEKREIPFGRPWIEDAERDAVLEVLKGHILTHGPNCAAFEAGFATMMGGGFAASTSSCMAALHLSSLDLKIGPGDEVIVPAQTHVATVHAVEITGATPVFVDSEVATGNMDVSLIEAAVTARTKAISIVHFAGIPIAMPDVLAIAQPRGLAVVEDCALAVGARYDGRHVGLFGHTGCYSFYPVKHITTAEGGMVVSQHQEVVKRIANFRAFSYERGGPQAKIPGIYDVSGVGMNYRMSEMQAALGVVQLAKLAEILARRAANFHALKGRLEALEAISVLDAADSRAMSSHYCLIAVLGGEWAGRRGEVVAALNARGVGTSIYYPHPVPRLKYYRHKYGYDAARYPGAETISDRAIALPVGPHLESGDMDYIAGALETVL